MSFSAISSFRVSMLDNTYEGSQRVVVQIGLETGLKILEADGNKSATLRSLKLAHITRWQCRGRSLVLYTQTPADVEERQITLEGDETTIRNVLDTLTCSCMQLAELLESKQANESSREAGASLNALVAGGGKKAPKGDGKALSADAVEYWRNPDKAGWMQSQGEHIKSWRKRWFVVKSGFLFRFYDANVKESVKPRGVVDLSKVQDIKAASGQSGRPNTIVLKTEAGGTVSYITDTETELVEWISALEGAVTATGRRATAAGDSSSAPKQQARPSPAAATPSGSDWMRQLERTMESFEATAVSPRGGGGGGTARARGSGAAAQVGSGSGRGGGASSASATMVQVVGYESMGGGGGGGGGAGGSGGLGYHQVAGAQVASGDMLDFGEAQQQHRQPQQHQQAYQQPQQQAYSQPQQQAYSQPQQQQQQHTYSQPQQLQQQHAYQQPQAYPQPQQPQQPQGGYYGGAYAAEPAAQSGGVYSQPQQQQPAQASAPPQQYTAAQPLAPTTRANTMHNEMVALLSLAKTTTGLAPDWAQYDGVGPALLARRDLRAWTVDEMSHLHDYQSNMMDSVESWTAAGARGEAAREAFLTPAAFARYARSEEEL
ncbi:hypothetical protein FOA52_001917 [Chlamydomonas sp. UWO 241]|nr:hypothetical protein FOA52_001917 [Chlamydomonas sp. UWO 241]